MKVRAFCIFSLLLLTLGMATTHCECESTTLHGICPSEFVCESDEDCEEGIKCEDGCCGGLVECTEETQEERCKTNCCKNYQCVPASECECEECVRTSECIETDPCAECIDGCCENMECASDADCPPVNDKPRYCPDPTTLGPDDCRTCKYIRCECDEDCLDPDFPLYVECTPPDKAKCINGECQCRPPCGGECPDGQYCCQKTQTCDPIPTPCYGVECPPCQQVNPEPGGTLNEETCEIEGADCTCVPLPPLPDAFSGQHSAIDLRPDGIPVLSGYYGQPYGDLLFGVASSAEAGATVEWTIVDGLPGGAECVGAADGPRGGIEEPGDDVGWDTDIVVDPQGRSHISYFDRTNGDLKYAVQQLDGTWLIQVVDSAGITGRFTSMVLDTAQRPIISYMTTRDAMKSYLKVARAKGANPAAPEDWDIIVVDEAPVPCLPGDCEEGVSVCLKETGTCAPLDAPAHCEDQDGNGCADTEACVAGSCEEKMKESSLEVLPPGVGLFTNLALYADNSPAVGYYDNTNGNLKFAWYNPGAGAFNTPVILAGEDGSGNDLGNLGSDVSMHITVPDEAVHVSFQDAGLGDLYYLTFSGRDTAGAVMELVDVGARDGAGNPTDQSGAVGEPHWVGNFSTILVDSLGYPRVVYQDGTSLDMLYAMRNAAGVWTVEIIARKLSGESFNGAWGFFTDQVMNSAGDLAIISNFKHNLRTDPDPYESGIDIRTK